MSFPTTLTELEAAGYERESYTRCKGCDESIEFWTTPNGQSIPMNFMRDGDSPAVSHFSTCPKADQFRKRPQRCTPIYPNSTTQESLLFPSPSSRSQASPSQTSSPDAPPCVEQPEKKGES